MIHSYPLVNVYYGKSPFFIGTSSINGSFSIAMLNNQRVIEYAGHGFVEGFSTCSQWQIDQDKGNHRGYCLLVIRGAENPSGVPYPLVMSK